MPACETRENVCVGVGVCCVLCREMNEFMVKIVQGGKRGFRYL